MTINLNNGEDLTLTVNNKPYITLRCTNGVLAAVDTKTGQIAKNRPEKDYVQQITEVVHPCKGCTSFWEIDSTCLDCRVYEPYAHKFPVVTTRCEYYNNDA